MEVFFTYMRKKREIFSATDVHFPEYLLEFLFSFLHALFLRSPPTLNISHSVFVFSFPFFTCNSRMFYVRKMCRFRKVVPFPPPPYSIYTGGGALSQKLLRGDGRRRCLLQPFPSFLPPGQLDISPLTKRGDRGGGKFHGIRIKKIIKIPLLSLVFYLKKTRTYYSGRKEIKNPGKLYDSVLPHLCPGWSYKKLQHHFPSPIFFPSFLPAA